MRGVVICELLAELERRLGVVGAERVRLAAAAPKDRIYTAFAEIPASEFHALLVAAEAAGQPRADLMRAIGGRIVQRLLVTSPHVTAGCDGGLDVLDRLPALCDAWAGDDPNERPSLRLLGRAPGHRELEYVNSFDGVDVAAGVIEAAASVFGDTVEIDVERQPTDRGVRATIRARIRKVKAA